jgi:hypothetical protein
VRAAERYGGLCVAVGGHLHLHAVEDHLVDEAFLEGPLHRLLQLVGERWEDFRDRWKIAVPIRDAVPFHRRLDAGSLAFEWSQLRATQNRNGNGNSGNQCDGCSGEDPTATWRVRGRHGH